MMRKDRDKKRAGQQKRQGIALTKTNYVLGAIALVVIVIGYVCLAQPPANGFLTLTVAPILLVVGYCVMMPLAILWRGKRTAAEQSGTTSSPS